MRDQDLDLRAIGEALLEGRLAEAKALAFWLANPHAEEVMAAWPDEAAQLRVGAAALERAQTVRVALRAEAQVAGNCGACHARAGVRAPFERDTIAPRDDGTTASRVQRHHWGAARLWDGVAGASEVQWRAGLEIFANDLVGTRTREIAARALAAHTPDRTAVFANLLDSCTSSCHPIAH